MNKIHWIMYILSLFVSSAFSQDNKKIDSLQKVLAISLPDTSRVQTLISLAEEHYLSSPTLALNDCLEAKKISESTHYNNGLSTSYAWLAYLYEQKGEVNNALDYYKKSLALFEKAKDKKNIATCLNNIAAIFKDQGKIAEALAYHNRSLVIKYEIKDTLGIATSYNNIALIHQNQGRIPEALEFYSKSLKLYEQINDKEGIATALGNIGYVYKDQKQYDQAFDYLNRGLKLLKEINYKYGIAYSLNSVGNICEEQGKPDVALQYYLEALQIRTEIDDSQGIGYSLKNLGNVYIKLGNNDKARESFQKSIAKFKELDDKWGTTTVNNLYGAYLIGLGDYRQGENYLNNSLSLAQALGYPADIRNAAGNLQRLYRKKKEWKSALEMNDLYIQMRDSVQNDKNRKAAIQNQFNYEFEKKESLLKSEQRKKDAIAEAERNKQKLITFFISLSLVFVLVFAGFVSRLLSIRNKQNKIIVAQKNIVEEKQQEILDSISYALKIQTAILPPQKIVKQYLENSFILYKPKDIVAGDFYWMQTVDDTILFAACDCTGHGVPGALVSVVCHNALNRAVREFGLTRPASILDKTAEILIENFSASEENIKDGMDISLCAYSPKTHILEWAGANNPLWLVQNGELTETKGDKQSIGKYDNRLSFTNHSFTLHRGETIYLFSDGFADQFGGDSGQKKLTRKRFRELILSIQSLSLQEQGIALDHFITAYGEETEQIDDILVMGVKV